MPLSVAVQMDPIAPIDIDADSTFALMLSAQARGHTLFYYTPDRLSQSSGAVVARGWPVTVRREAGNHFTLGAEETRDLSETDVILLRQDPPFDMSYITTTHVLERIHPQTLVVNDPFWVRNCPEKLLVADFPDLTPPTLITRDLAALRAFVEHHGGAIVKPLYGNGGVGVFRVGADAMNLNALHELFVDRWREPYIAQQFLPEVTGGDKRIILIDGEPAGVINRIPAKGETRSNMHVGGKAVKDTLSERDREICARIGPTLRERGLIFVGIDVIGQWLTEINVTSPTGIQELSRFDGVDIAGQVWDAIEARKRG